MWTFLSAYIPTPTQHSYIMGLEEVGAPWTKVWINPVVGVISCICVFSLGWYRASCEGCAPRRQCPQPAQHPGHHHSELFISPPSSHPATSSPSVLWSVCVSAPSLLSTVYTSTHASQLNSFEFFCLFIALTFCSGPALFCFNFLFGHTVLCSAISMTRFEAASFRSRADTRFADILLHSNNSNFQWQSLSDCAYFLTVLPLCFSGLSSSI